MTDIREALFIGRTTDGRTVRRPLSPHLQVYKPQITTALSIFHRITGVALSVGTILMVWWLVAAASSDGAYSVVAAVVHSWLGHLVIFGWTAALWYHFCNGIRHLAWDAGYGFELDEVHATGRIVLIATAVLTVLTLVVGLFIV